MGKNNSSLFDNYYFLMIGSFIVGIVVSRLMSQRNVINGDIKEGWFGGKAWNWVKKEKKDAEKGWWSDFAKWYRGNMSIFWIFMFFIVLALMIAGGVLKKGESIIPAHHQARTRRN